MTNNNMTNNKWISSKVARPGKKGLYLVTDGINWRVLLVADGEVMKYEDWDDGYTTDKYYINKEWWWMPLPNLPNGETPYYL